jgi:hypothetical protein
MHRPPGLLPAGRKPAETGDRFAGVRRDRTRRSGKMRGKAGGHGRFGHFPIRLGGIFGRGRSRRERAVVVERRVPVRPVGGMGVFKGAMVNCAGIHVSRRSCQPPGRTSNHEPRTDGDITLPFMADVPAGKSCVVSGRGG